MSIDNRSMIDDQFSRPCFRHICSIISISFITSIIAAVLTGCSSVSPSVTEHAGQYTNVISYELDAIKSSLHRRLFTAGPIDGPRTVFHPVGADNLILNGATFSVLRGRGYISGDSEYTALRILHSNSDISDPYIFKQFCASRGGEFNAIRISLTRDRDADANPTADDVLRHHPFSNYQVCSVKQKLLFAINISYNGPVLCTGGYCESDFSYSTVSMTSPTALKDLPKSAWSELLKIFPIKNGFRGNGFDFLGEIR